MWRVVGVRGGGGSSMKIGGSEGLSVLNCWSDLP